MTISYITEHMLYDHGTIRYNDINEIIYDNVKMRHNMTCWCMMYVWWYGAVTMWPHHGTWCYVTSSFRENLFLRFILFLDYGLCVYMSGFVYVSTVSMGPDENIWSPEAGVTSCWEPPDVVQVWTLLAAQPSLQPLWVSTCQLYHRYCFPNLMR